MLSTSYQKATTELNSHFHKLDVMLFNSELTSSMRKTIVTIQTKGKHSAYGWCTSREAWLDEEGTSFEVNLSAEYLNRPLKEILETLIHEMVHLKNSLDGIQDTSRKGTYHNKRFKSLAESVGLVVEESEKHGYAHTSLSENLEESLSDNFDLRNTIQLARQMPTKGKPAKKVKSYTYQCPECGQAFKTAKTGLHVMCEDCNETMEELED